MARFVESAVLKVIDQSSRPLSSIEKALRHVQREAERLSKTQLRRSLAGIEGVSAKGAAASFRQLGEAYSRLGGRADSLTSKILGVNSALNRQSSLARRAATSLEAIKPPRRFAMPADSVRAERPRGLVGRYRDADATYRAAEAGRRLRSAVTNESVVDISQARANITRANLPGDEANRLEAIASKIIAKFPAMSRAEALQTALETRQSVPKIENVEPIVNELARAFQASLATGASRQDSARNLQYLTKAAGMTGKLLDSQGNATPDALRGMLDAFIKGKVLEGRAIDARRFFELMKYSRVSGATMDNDAILRAVLEASDMGGSSTGVAINQLVKNLTGSAKVSALEALYKAGLANGRYETGASGRQKFVFGGIKDEEALRANPWEFVRSKMLGPEGTLTKAGVDVNNTAAVAKWVNTITSDRTAQGILTNIITQLKEGDTKIENVRRANISEQDLRSESSRNINAAWQELQGAFSTAIGDLAEKASSVTIPAINGLTTAVTALGGAASESPMTAMLAALGAGAGVFKAGQALSNNPMARKAWTSINPVAGLNDSASALTKSAAELSAAAQALKAAAPGRGVGGGPVSTMTGTAAAAGAGAVAAEGRATSRLVASEIAKEAAGGIASKIPTIAKGVSGLAAPFILSDLGEAIKGETTGANFRPRFGYGFNAPELDAAALEKSRRIQEDLRRMPEMGRATGFRELQGRVLEESRQSAEEFKTVFSSGGNLIQAAAKQIETSAAQLPGRGGEFGQNAVPALVAAGSAFGDAAAAKISAAALNFNLSGPKPVNTGSNIIGLR